ncbi:MAG: glycosyltransferase family 4 protein [Candidatus Peregrinibacteria bacterium]
MKPKVVFLSAFLSPYRSGAEACVEEVAWRLAEEFDITIVTAKLTKRTPEDDPFRKRVKVIRVGIGSSFDKWLFPFLAPFAVRKIKPSIVHAVLESYAGLAVIFCRWLFPSAKRILTCQSTNTSLFVGGMHRSADRVTVISAVLLERAEDFGRKDALLIPNGIDAFAIETERTRQKKVPGRILFVGRLEPMKGIDVLLRALSRLTPPSTLLRTGNPSPPLLLDVPESSNPENFVEQRRGEIAEGVHLRIVGRGSQWDSLHRLAQDLDIADRVTFTGYIPPPRVYEEFAQAQIFCGLSRSEALGNVFLEAQAAGCVVVATNVGGIPDIVEHERTGLLVPSDDSEAAAKALELLLLDPRKWAELAERGMVNSRTYDWDGIAERYAELWRGLLAG